MVKNLTQRETEILSLLKNDPMISQEDLAERLNITRSAAAVHISNLIKKGAILGRGYVFNERSGIAFCGVTFFHTIGHKDDGTGINYVDENIWGVCFQIALYMINFVPCVKFFGVVGRDEKGEKIVSALNKAGIDTTYFFRNKDFPTAHRIDILSSNIIKESLMDSRIIQHSFPSYLESRKDFLQSVELLVIDDRTITFWSTDFITHLAEQVKVCIISPEDHCDWRNVPLHDNVFFVEKTNMLGPKDDDNVRANIIQFSSSNGAWLKHREIEETVPFLPGQAINYSGSFEVFTASLIRAIWKNLSLRQAVRIALGYCCKFDPNHQEKHE